MTFTISIRKISYKVIHNFEAYCGVINIRHYPLFNPYYKAIIDTELAKFNAKFSGYELLTFDTEADYTWFLLAYS